ncbi:hypothetical protein PHMEG_00024099 [Phytophthora megakarya]|uniref:Peptidase A2 domain-containing protein n=1 Tax=Phytophthora megakarya TaxID=4795 RepID=A0A225VEI5_9STRA|nr:hypothetical protein PHMEG_00024099 [Phytophthora megakarya]
MKDGNGKERREHVDHYIETLEDQDRAKNRQKKAAFGSNKYRQKPTNSTPSTPAKQVRAIQIQANDSESDSESDGSGRSDSDVDIHRKIVLAANEDVAPKAEKESASLDPRLPERDQGHQDHILKIHGFKPTDHEVTPEFQRPNKIAEYRRSKTMDPLPGESRGYWKHHSPGKWFRQAKITGKIHNEKAILLLDTGAEVSIVDTAFAALHNQWELL